MLKISNKVQGLLVHSILKIMVQLQWLCELKNQQVAPPVLIFILAPNNFLYNHKGLFTLEFVSLVFFPY